MEEISEIQKVGRRLDSLKNHIREKSPKEVWIIDKIHILFVKLISTGIEKRIELETIRELNDLVDSFEFRFGQMFEQKINTKTRLLIREAIVNLLEEDSKFSEGDAVTTKEGDKGVVTFGKHPFYAVKLDNTGTTHSYHFSDLELDPTASPEGMDFGKYDTTEPEQPQQDEPELQEIKVNTPNKIWDFRKYISDFNFKDIKKGDKIITKSNGSLIVHRITQHGWDYNYGDIFWFGNEVEGSMGKSFSNKDLLQRNERNKKNIIQEIKVNKPIELPRPKSGESLKDFIKRIKLEAGFKSGLLYIDKNVNGYSSKLTTQYFPEIPTEEIGDKDIFLKSLVTLFKTRFKDKIQLKLIKNTNRGYGGPNGSYTVRLVTKIHPKDLILSGPNSLQESSPQDIVHLDGLLTVNDDLNVTDVMSDIRSITGITIVKPIDIPGESHKNKLKIKIDPFPFSNKDPEFIRQQIKILIRKIPGVREFWSGKIIEPLSERKYKIKDPK